MTKRLTQFRCVTHNVEFGFDTDALRDVEPPVFGDCPLCHREKFDLVRAELNEVRSQRDALLKAIDIKKLIVRAKAI